MTDSIQAKFRLTWRTKISSVSSEPRVSRVNIEMASLEEIFENACAWREIPGAVLIAKDASGETRISQKEMQRADC